VCVCVCVCAFVPAVGPKPSGHRWALVRRVAEEDGGFVRR